MSTISAMASSQALETMVAPQSRTAWMQLAGAKPMGTGGEHGDVVGLVAGTVDMVHGNAQPLSETADHAALVGALGGHLQQRLAGEDQLIIPIPALLDQGLLHPLQHLVLRLEEELPQGQRHIQQRGSLRHQHLGDVLMLVGKRIGPDTVDDIINVIGFHRHLREPVQHLLAPLPAVSSSSA